MAGTDVPVFNQLKKGQGETNDRLDALDKRMNDLLVELKRTNELLQWVCNSMHEASKV